MKNFLKNPLTFRLLAIGCIVLGSFVVFANLVIIPGRLRVNVPNVNISKLSDDEDGTVETTAPNPDIIMQKSQPDKTVPLVKTIANSPKQAEIKSSVNEELPYYIMATSNDTYYGSNWFLQKLNVPSAWDTTTGSSSVVVAVIDSGFALAHEDLIAQWQFNAGEQGTTAFGEPCWTGVPASKQTNNCDDDANGYLDDYRGWDFYAIDNEPQAGAENPGGSGVSHGTQVAGLVGATGNNAKGIATVSWQNKIMPLQVTSDDGLAYTSDVSAAIYYAVDNGADVINISLGGSGFDPYLRDAINYAYQNNVVVVAAAGNCGSSTTGFCASLPAGGITYPARYNHVIAVGALTQADERASFSSYGPALDVSAPGSGTIISTTWTSGNGTTAYAGSLHGTSFASPIVASLAGLIKTLRPTSSADDIHALIAANTTKIGAMGDPNYAQSVGHGLVNAASATAVASHINANVASSVTLLQSGNSAAEGRYSQNSGTSSGCQAPVGQYCTIWLKALTQPYERYLPYKQTAADSRASWSWNTALLGTDSWEARSIQGVTRSAPYQLMTK